MSMVAIRRGDGDVIYAIVQCSQEHLHGVYTGRTTSYYVQQYEELKVTRAGRWKLKSVCYGPLLEFDDLVLVFCGTSSLTQCCQFSCTGTYVALGSMLLWLLKFV